MTAPSTATKPPAIPRPAATVVVVRDGPLGLEVLLLQRPLSARFMPGAYVFPGGAVDRADTFTGDNAPLADMSDEQASCVLNLEHGGLAYFVAAIRECFEESGLLFATELQLSALSQAASAQLPGARHALIDGTLSMADLCQRHGLQLAASKLHYFSHWITPLDVPIRFDTRFFVACAPQGQMASLAGEELQQVVWIAPRDALEAARSGKMRVMFPTKKTLEELATFEDTGSFFACARAPCSIVPVLPNWRDVPENERAPLG